MTKKKSSKLLAAFLCLTMSVWALAGCGGSGDGEEAANDSDKGGKIYTASEVTSELSFTDDVKAYYDAVDMEYAFEQSKELAYNWDELAEPLGWRTAGSDSEHATADYLAKEMEKIGLDKVEKVATTCDKFQNNGTSMKIAGSDVDFKGGSRKAVEAGTNGPAPYQVNGTDGNLTAEIVNCKTGFEADYEGKDVKGKIVLVKVDQLNESWIDSYMHEAKNQGAAAIVTWSNSGYGELGPDTTNVQDVCCGDIIPAVAISANQAKKVKAAIKAGKTECTLNIDTEMVSNGGTTYNVCGMIPGKSHDEKLIVSAHYDKYWYGFQDDCAAIGLVLAVGKAMVDSGYEPENDIYFVCHGAEEWGVSDSMYDWTTGAWGMVNEHNMADGVRAMFNFELPAFNLDKAAGMATVPEYYDMVDTMFDSGLIVTAGDVSFKTKPSMVTTMEDGISYREYGAPYFLNNFEGETFMCERYHTQADNEETYSEDVLKTNINWCGAYAMYIDKEPAIELNIANSAGMLKDGFNKKYAKEAGVDIDEYLAAVDELEKAGQALYDKAVECNAAYEEAVANDDKDAIAAAGEEADKINKKNLDAFQMINEDFLRVTDFTADYGHTPYNWNVEQLDGVLAGLEAGEVWADTEYAEGEGGAGDYAWNLNTQMEYSYMLFSMETADRQIAAHEMSYYEDKNQAQWGWNHMYEPTKTGEASYELLHAATIKDIKDVDAMIETYKAAREDQIALIGADSARELTQMKQITEILK
ncbi:MAG: M28 family peptidase [Bacillota bacterium]|nr:M28 family peptidase [Bacillota bacterium]